jgi:aryl-alcohol dehydrogenase-like predicted oxidoreductase
MELRSLGQTAMKVSALGLGTMTWGEQNTEAEGHAQMDAAVAHGVNLFDAAEMYPVPPKAETSGRTEETIGTWFAARPGAREKVVLATKITGPGPGFGWLRDSGTRFTWEHLVHAVEGSLRRLRTDRIDLYQLHWPDRHVNSFGKLDWTVSPDEAITPPEVTLEALDRLVRSGKVLHIGVSNETPWGLMKFLAASDTNGWPRMASIQNPYSLLNRSFEVGLAEIAVREQVGLLAYSPLAMGMLTGKFQGGAVWPADARLTRFERFVRYRTPVGMAQSEKYVALAREHGLDPAHLALAFVTRQPWLASTLVGATSVPQLEHNLRAAEVVLTPEVIAGVERIHKESPNPCP